jgi:hypothetical protein
MSDCKLSHGSSKKIDKTTKWLRAEYESIFEDGSGAIKVHRGKVHKYLGMSLDFSHKGQVFVTMHDYLDGIIKTYDAPKDKHDDGFLPVTKQCYEMPVPENLFMVDEDCEKLPEEMAADFHTIVAKTLYVTKRTRRDICLAIAFLITRVRAPNKDDWEKLRHLMGYLRNDHARPIVLVSENNGKTCGMSTLHLQCIQICVATPVEA